MSLFDPTASELAGTVNCALPPLSDVVPRLVLPQASVTEPVGVGFPARPLTVTVTVALSVVVMLDGFGVTVTVGVMSVGAAETVSEPVPDPPL